LLSRRARGDEVPDRHLTAEAPDDRNAPANGAAAAMPVASAATPVNGVATEAHLNGVATGRHRAHDQLGPRVAIRRSPSGAHHSPTPERPPAVRFADVLAIREFRTIYSAAVLSWIGDYAARAAVTALVLRATDSILAAAAAFAITYAPWLLGGQLLVALAERYPYRRVMVVCDLARMVIMASVAIPGLPLPAVLGLLLASALFGPPFDAARSATMPAVLPGDRYVVGMAFTAASIQPVQVAGYLTGSALAAVNPRIALLINAATFAVSAALVRFGVSPREPALRKEARTHLLRETMDGFKLVFGTTALRTIALMMFGAAAVAVVPEGLGAPWAAQVSGARHGLAQGLIMASVPFGMIIGALVVGRMLAPETRRRLLGAFAIAVPVPLVLAAVNPPVAIVAVLGAATGVAFGALSPVANGAFVAVLPPEFRARAFGVVAGGLQLVQGFAVLLTGFVAAHALPVGAVVGCWCVAGAVLMLCLVHPWTGAARVRVPGSAPLPGTMEP
jgi:MFS family permease